MLRRAREFFESRDVLEVDTPILCRYAVTDPHIESLSARSSLRSPLFLQTSPEYRMKRLLAAGFGDIFQVAKVFRDGESGRRHLPEFTLVEWYRVDYGLRQIMDETIEFVATALQRSDLGSGAGFFTYAEAFGRVANLDPHTASVQQLADCLGADDELRNALANDRDAWLDLLLAERIVPDFAEDRLTVLHHYPKSQAALARLSTNDANCAERFEVFYGNVELANGFVELIDADEQLARFQSDRNSRREKHLPVHDIDENLINALRAGVPPCAGVAVGFDRLLMLEQGETDIASISHFPEFD